MSEFRDALSQLEHAVSKEVARLSRPISIDARSELVFHLWPVVRDLIDALQWLENEEAAIPVDLIARTVGLMMGMLNHIGRPVAEEQLAEIAAHVQEVADELIALVDADELAAYVASTTARPEQPISNDQPVAQPATVEDAVIVDAPAPETPPEDA